MAVTENLYTGNGSSTNYSFTFPYLETTDIKVSINGTITTAYTLANPTTIQFTTAPANGAAIRIYRVTDDSALAATFYSGAAIRATDLNENFTQNLYVTQESNREATTAITTANSATSTANTALSTANAATVTANAASASAASAVSTAASAVSTANSAVSTANAASASAASAVATANTANTNATAALNAAAEALAYVIVANVAAIPASPVNGDAIRVTNSTGIESFTPLSGKPVGFVGDAGLTVEIYYSSSTSSWVWVRYYAGDPENRYASAADMTQAQSDILGLDTQKLDVTTAGTTYAPLASPTFTGSPSGPSFSVTGSTAPTNGIYLPSANSVAISTGSSERARIDTSGRLLVGTSSALDTEGVVPRIQSADAGNQAGFGAFRYSANAPGPILHFFKSRGTSVGTNTIVADADVLGEIRFAGADGTNEITGAKIETFVDGTPGANDMPGRLVFSTTADGASSPTERMRISNTGRVTLANSCVGTPSTLTDAATIAVDLAAANNFTVTLGGNRTLGAPTNVVAGQSGVIRVVQDGTGSRTLAYNSVFKFPGGTAPTLTTTANAVDLLAYHVESTTRIAVRFIGDVK